MGANATTFVPAYVAGEVLTAADLSVTNSGIPVFADSTARDAAFGGTGEKTLAEGQYAYLESTNATQVYDGSNWVSVGVSPGLVLIKTQTIGSAVSSVTVSDVFSSTYDNYKIIVSGGVASSNSQFTLTLGATTTGYYRFGTYGFYTSSGVSGINTANGSGWQDTIAISTATLTGSVELIGPNLAKVTTYNSIMAKPTNEYALSSAGYVDNTTQYTAFTFTCAGGTVTGGTIKVYGYANS